MKVWNSLKKTEAARRWQKNWVVLNTRCTVPWKCMVVVSAENMPKIPSRFWRAALLPLFCFLFSARMRQLFAILQASSIVVLTKIFPISKIQFQPRTYLSSATLYFCDDISCADGSFGSFKLQRCSLILEFTTTKQNCSCKIAGRNIHAVGCNVPGGP